jgi:hypothetical protein
MTRALVLLLTALMGHAQAVTEPPMTVDPAPPVPTVAPATPSVQGGQGSSASSPTATLPDVQLPQPPTISPAAVQKSTSTPALEG